MVSNPLDGVGIDNLLGWVCGSWHLRRRRIWITYHCFANSSRSCVGFGFKEILFYFIEKDKKRAKMLSEVLAKEFPALPRNIKYFVEGDAELPLLLNTCWMNLRDKVRVPLPLHSSTLSVFQIYP